ncbi:hypothetical protein RB195_000569 [Necator americanus]|uniref:Uncharacterized protein n=1 Tax=Necator americanus TaxID=51031 RepID=A0ABR1DAD2_NECAM
MAHPNPNNFSNDDPHGCWISVGNHTDYLKLPAVIEMGPLLISAVPMQKRMLELRTQPLASRLRVQPPTQMHWSARRFDLTARHFVLTAQGIDLTGRRFVLTAQSFDLTAQGFDLTVQGFDLTGRRFDLTAQCLHKVLT